VRAPARPEGDLLSGRWGRRTGALAPQSRSLSSHRGDDADSVAEALEAAATIREAEEWLSRLDMRHTRSTASPWRRGRPSASWSVWQRNALLVTGPRRRHQKLQMMLSAEVARGVD
jgi:hypothetical protein